MDVFTDTEYYGDYHALEDSFSNSESLFLFLGLRGSQQLHEPEKLFTNTLPKTGLATSPVITIKKTNERLVVK